MGLLEIAQGGADGLALTATAHGLPRLPVHGFVLAGGQSRRMGTDKALLRLGGVPMVEIAVERLREFCSAVSVAGNREDLREFAAVIPEGRPLAGPGAGVEAGLAAASEDWALFTPVDVPFVPAALLCRWAEAVLGRSADGCAGSFLRVSGDGQPAFAMLRAGGLGAVSAALDGGERRLDRLLQAAATGAGGELWVAEAECFVGAAGAAEAAGLFRNLNTPGEFLVAGDVEGARWPAGVDGEP